MNNPAVNTDVGSISAEDAFWYSTPKSKRGGGLSEEDESTMKMLSMDQDDTSLTKMIPDEEGRRASVSLAKKLKYLTAGTRESSRASLAKTRAKLAKHKEDRHLEGYRALSCRRRCGLLALAVVFALSATGTIVMWATSLFEDMVMGTMVMSNNSNTWEMRRAPTVTPLFKVYIFNYTNMDAVARGEAKRLKVQEVGPFTYSEKTEKVDVVFHANSTLSYREKKTYEFLPEMSAPGINSKVFVPNIPYMAAMARLRDENYFARAAASVFLSGFDAKPIIHVKVHDLLFGYPDRLFALARFAQINGDIPFENFGLLAPKVGVSPHVITMHTGEDDISRLGEITHFNGEYDQGAWGSDQCNRISGSSDGSQFPPGKVTPDARLYVYNRDMCRRLPLVFQDYVEAQGLPAYRFHMPRNVFDNPRVNPENSCFCAHQNKDMCLPSGVFNSSPCAFGAPVVMSFPHFLFGDESLFKPVEGLHPDQEKHDMFVDVHPKLGLTLGGRSRLQLNVQVRKASFVQPGLMSIFKDLSVLPVAWFELIVTDYPADLKTLLYHATITVHVVQVLLMYGLLGASIASAAVLCRRLFLRRRASLELSNVQFMDSDSP